MRLKVVQHKNQWSSVTFNVGMLGGAENVAFVFPVWFSFPANGTTATCSERNSETYSNLHCPKNVIWLYALVPNEKSAAPRSAYRKLYSGREKPLPRPTP